MTGPDDLFEKKLKSNMMQMLHDVPFDFPCLAQPVGLAFETEKKERLI